MDLLNDFKAKSTCLVLVLAQLLSYSIVCIVGTAHFSLVIQLCYLFHLVKGLAPGLSTHKIIK